MANTLTSRARGRDDEMVATHATSAATFLEKFNAHTMQYELVRHAEMAYNLFYITATWCLCGFREMPIYIYGAELAISLSAGSRCLTASALADGAFIDAHLTARQHARLARSHHYHAGTAAASTAAAGTPASILYQRAHAAGQRSYGREVDDEHHDTAAIMIRERWLPRGCAQARSRAARRAVDECHAVASR